MKKFKTILFEGNECVGKTTQIKEIYQQLKDKGFNVVIFKEPTREMLEVMDDKMLFGYDKFLKLQKIRTELYTKLIEMYNHVGIDYVLFDRGVLSTLVYQKDESFIGKGSDMLEKIFKELPIQPDVIFVDTVSFDIYQKRLEQREKNEIRDYLSKSVYEKYNNEYESLVKRVKGKYTNNIYLNEENKLERILEVE